LDKKKDNTSTMDKPAVVSIFIAPGARQPTASVEKAHAVPGKGLEGDRYFNLTGTFCDNPGPSYEVTLIEMEAVDALKRDYKVDLGAGDTRRNIVTRGVALNHLVGHEFKVGAVSLRGIRLCEPCAHLEKLTRPGIISGLIHRGGLRAQILTEGEIRVGDPVCEA
jgi:MOSC domain-containing protein YiiM